MNETQTIMAHIKTTVFHLCNLSQMWLWYLGIRLP